MTKRKYGDQHKFWCDVEMQNGHIVSFEVDTFKNKTQALEHAVKQMQPLGDGWLITTYRCQQPNVVRIAKGGQLFIYNPTEGTYNGTR